jgi:hypothetical protein
MYGARITIPDPLRQQLMRSSFEETLKNLRILARFGLEANHLVPLT